MRKTLFYALAILPALMVAGCDQTEDETPAEKPSIELGVTGNISVSRDGGEISIPYTISNPSDEGKISASVNEDVTWVNGFNYDTENTVVCHADENTQTQNRNAIVTLTYTYGSGESVTAQVNVIQEAAIAYDYTLEAESFRGHYYGTNYGKNGEYNYYTWISDLPFDDLGRTQVGGTYYLFDLYAGAPESEDKPLPPAGTYTLGETASTAEMTFSREYSRVRATDTDGNLTLDVYFAEGTVTIAYGDGTMEVEAKLQDTEGKWHHVVYNQPVPEYLIGDGGTSSGGYLTIERDTDMEPSSVSAGYMGEGESEDVMDVVLTFSDIETDENGNDILPGYNLGIEFFTPYDEDGAIAEGTYTIDAAKAENKEAFSIVPGEMQTLLYYLFPYETFLEYLEPAENPDEEPLGRYGFCCEGTMTVKKIDSGYEIHCDFYTDEGMHVTCSYTGNVAVSGVPGPISTLDGDYTLDLSNATDARAIDFGDIYYAGGDMWMIEIYPGDGVTGDGFMTTIVGKSTDFAAGIPSGTYKACASNYYMNVGEYLYGYLSSSLNGTFYLSGFQEDGSVTEYAPAISGDLNIENHGDGTYTFSFEFLDDRGYTWDGEWTGIILTENNGSESYSAPSVSLSAAHDKDLRTERKPVSAASDSHYLFSSKL